MTNISDSATHHKIGSDLYLIRQTIPQNNTAKVTKITPPAHHVLIIDCSGSMSGDLPKIREQLKKKLPRLLQEKDLISMVWFSGKGQHGVLFEAEPVPTLADLKTVNTAVDRWLKPIGLTGFKEPLEDATTLIARIAKKHPTHAPSLFFMSDGCDNQWDRASILTAVEKTVQSGVASTTIVEYGYYADRAFLAKMAEKAGGSLIFAEDFDRYDPIFESTIQKRTASTAKRVHVEISKSGPGASASGAIGSFAFALHDGDLLTFAQTSSIDGWNSIAVPEGIQEIAYLSATPVGLPGLLSDLNEVAKNAAIVNRVTEAQKVLEPSVVSTAYAALSLFATRMKPEIVFPILKALGDVAFIEKFANCFGKQRYSEFQDFAKSAAFKTDHRFTSGRDPSRVPPEDAFTVLDLLALLQEDDGNRVLLDHPEFKYSRISRGRKDADATEEALKFVADPAPDGYPISSIVWNEDRPNVSFMVRKEGRVDISTKIQSANATVPAKSIAKLPTQFPTFIFRNYAVVKDGLVNIEVLPVKLTEATTRKLFDLGKAAGHDCAVSCVVPRDINLRIKESSGVGGLWLIDLKALPIINRKMIKAASAKKLFEDAYELTKRRAAQKVFNTFQKEKFPKESKGYKVVYGDEAAAWLKEQGLTDYNGFAPKQVQAPSTDFYIGKELSTHLKGLSSLPSMKEAIEKRTKGKLTPSAALLTPYIKQVENFLDTPVYKKAQDKDKVFEAWLGSESHAATKAVRSLMGEMARTKFAIVVGQSWFTEFDSIDQNQLSILADDGSDLECRVEMKEVEIPI
jgi:hypothetical protein